MGKFKKLEGQQIGTWIIVAEYKGDKTQPAKVLCKCAVCGYEKLYDRKSVMYHETVCNKCKPLKKRTKGNASICIDCVNSCGNCSWSAKLKPVEGWTATSGKRLIGDRERTTYCVTECPQFKGERKE